MRRFSNEFKVAFDAWLKTNLLESKRAARPKLHARIPESANLARRRRESRGERVFDEGTAARKQSEEYTGTTVVLATVLFVALSPFGRAGCGLPCSS